MVIVMGVIMMLGLAVFFIGGIASGVGLVIDGCVGAGLMIIGFMLIFMSILMYSFFD